MMNRRDMFGRVAAAGFFPSITQLQGSIVPDGPFRIVDTNISLFRWPFRRLPLDDTASLVQKLHSLGVASAWAGSFEGLIHRDISAVNERLVAECHRFELLTPVGSINPALPGWENDLRQCLEQHAMKIIRLHPGYHGYQLQDPRFQEILKQTAAAGCMVQLAVAMEDTRTQHVRFRTPDVDLEPLAGVMSQVTSARVQLLNYRPRGALFEELTRVPGLHFDVARVEGTDGVPALVASVSPDRVLFGSHSPFLIPEAAMIRVHESGRLDDESLRRIYATNAKRLMSEWA